MPVGYFIQGALHFLVDVAAIDGAFNQGGGFSSLSRQMRRFAFDFRLGELDQGVHERSLRLLLKDAKCKPSVNLQARTANTRTCRCIKKVLPLH